MMAPDNKTKETNRHHRVNHRPITKDGFSRENTQNITDHSHGRQNHNINFRVTEKPEKVLPQKGLAPIGWVKKARARIQIQKEHSRRCREDWHS